MRMRTLLAVSTYDRVAAWLLAGIALVGSMTLVMFLIWLSLQPAGITAPPRVTVGGGPRPDPRSGDSLAAVSELELASASFDTLNVTSVEQTFQWIEDLAKLAAALEVPESVSSKDGASGPGKGQGTGITGGGPKSREIGKRETPIEPRWKRWVVRFSTRDIAEFARQLDYFQIELGAFGGGQPGIDLCSRLSASRPTSRNLPSGRGEKRLFFAPARATDRQWTRKLLERAGIQTVGRECIHLYSADVESQLAAAESAFMRGSSLADVERTEFRIRRGAGGYEFYVAEQKMRR